MSQISISAGHPVVQTQDEIERLLSLAQREEEAKFLGLTPVDWKEAALLTIATTLAVTAGMVAVVGLVGFLVVHLAAPIAIAAIVVGGVVFTIYGVMYHYDSERHLATYRNEIWTRYLSLRESMDIEMNGYQTEASIALLKKRASNLLNSVAKEHGWENMFAYGIPLPSQFEEMFLFQVSHLELNEAVDLYITIKDEYRKLDPENNPNMFKYKIPHPREWRCADIENGAATHWIKETHDMPLIHIFEKYDIEKLQGLELIDSQEAHDLLELKERYQSAKSHFELAVGPYRDFYLTSIAKFESQKKKDLAAIKRQYEGHAAFDKIEQLRHEQLSELRNIHACKKNELKPILKMHAEIHSEIESAIERGQDPAFWQRREGESEQAIEAIEQRYEALEKEMFKRFANYRSQYVRELEAAETIKNEAEERAQRRYEESIAPFKRDYERSAGEEKVRYDQTLSELTETYNLMYRNGRAFLPNKAI